MDVSSVIEAVIAHLTEKLPNLQIEHFPENPADFQLNHPVGAVLVNYPGSRFGKPEAIGPLTQPHVITLNATVVLRQLNGPQGAVATLDEVRRTLCGYQPPNCRRKIWLMREMFLGKAGELWQYTLDFATESVSIEDANLPDGPLLTVANYKESK
ncbi:Gp37 family protein [Brenneria izbisi]|uniref:Gp37 family protein n=1 Tax=Brenneria izbisi TaxID=2939450 RepID=A0AA41XUQ3_9GAMM|nr:Gp37 family protein [Brenneria izbisi]MCV9878845.1 Gp37 family protein [Brenneria izbisi]MCV9882490.1 Gp37 family protein [Brenneria izbisi]